MDWRLSINGLDCVLPDDFSFEKDFQAIDIFEPSIRTSDIVQEFILPFTQENRIAFGFSENVESGGKLTKSIKYNCILEFNGNTTEGTITLNSITDGYNCQIVIDNGNWMQLLNGVNLNDIDFSDLNHTYDYTTQLNTENAGTWPYIYDFINRGFPQVNDIANTGYSIVNVHDRMPALKFKTIIERMLSSIGWKYSSKFIDSVEFWKCCLVLNTNYPKISETVRRAGSAFTRPTQADSTPLWPGVSMPFAPSGTGISVGSNISLINGNTTIKINQNYYGIIGHSLGIENTNPSVAYDITLTMFISNTGNSNIPSKQFSTTINVQPSTTATISIQSDYLFFLQNSEISFAVNYVTSSGYPYFNYKTTGSYVNLVATDRLIENGTFVWSENLDNTKCSDLITQIKETFNLCFRANVFEKTVTIEPFDDFILDISQAVDMTNKIDLNSTPEITFLDLPKKLEFKGKKDDKDGWLTAYNDRNSDEYGEYNTTLANQFSNEIKQIAENAFTPTALLHMNFQLNEIDWIPTIVSMEDNSMGVISERFEHRILRYDGKVNLTGSIPLLWGYWNNFDGLPTTLISRVEYPKFRSLYFKDTNIDGTFEEGLFSKHWRNWIAAYTAGELRTFFVQLNPYDINNFTPRKLVWLEVPQYGGSYYIVNRLTTPLNEKDLCRIELIPFTGKAKVVTPLSQILGKDPSREIIPPEISSGIENNAYYVKKAGAKIFQVDLSTGEIKTTGKPVYTEDDNGNIMQVFTTDDNGNILPVLTF